MTSLKAKRIRVNQDTVLTASPADSSSLPPAEVLLVPKGKEFEIVEKVGSKYEIRAFVWNRAADLIEPTRITPMDYLRIANKLGIEVATVRAVAEVESAGHGFLDDGRPKILFEAHWFAKFTGGKFNASHPEISSPKWDRSLYKGGATEWNRLAIAIGLDRVAALMSTSWGLGQVMGFNYRPCGYKSIGDFVDAMHESEGKQLEAMFEFIRTNNLHGSLQRKDWAAFARGYNGPAFAANRYDEKLADAYRKHSGQ